LLAVFFWSHARRVTPHPDEPSAWSGESFAHKDIPSFAVELDAASARDGRRHGHGYRVRGAMRLLDVARWYDLGWQIVDAGSVDPWFKPAPSWYRPVGAAVLLIRASSSICRVPVQEYGAERALRAGSRSSPIRWAWAATTAARRAVPTA
jgi:hypothetical protein